MKTLRKEATVKSVFKKVAYLGILATIVASCGSDNSTNDTTTNGFNDTYNVGSIENRTGVQCAQGGRRLQDEVYHTSETGLNQLYGPFNPGALPNGGSVAGTYVGVTMFGDVMTVSKITDGGTRVLGYNVRISYCEYRTQEGYPYIAPERNHQTIIGAMVLDSDNFCGFGSVDAASSQVRLDAWQGQSQSGYPIYDYSRSLDKTYFKPNCNGMY